MTLKNPGRVRAGLILAAAVAIVLAAINLTRPTATTADPTSSPSSAGTVAVAQPLAAAESPRFSLSGVIRGDDGRPIAAALACDHPAFSGAVTCARSQGDGAFALRVIAGLHKLEVVPPAGSSLVPAWYPKTDRSRYAQYLDLRKADVANLVVQLSAGYRVSGKTVDLSGAPVADAQACYSPTQTDIDWTCVRTDADGKYGAVVAGGDYLIFFVPPGGSRLITRWWRFGADELTGDVLRVRQDLEGIDVTFPAGNLIVGKVLSANGRPVEHALVCIDTKFPTGRICRPTNKQGDYQIAIRRGSFLIQFIGSAGDGVVNGWYGGGSNPSSAREIFVGGDLKLDASLRSGRLLWGSVHDADGLPVQGTYVNAYDLSGNFVAGGSARMSGDYGIMLPPGRYRVQAYPPMGTSYIATYAGGADGRIIEIKDKDRDAVADFVLDRAPVPAGN